MTLEDGEVETGIDGDGDATLRVFPPRELACQIAAAAAMATSTATTAGNGILERAA